jgi:predicted DNA-binding transcriptional regulator AlpA
MASYPGIKENFRAKEGAFYLGIALSTFWLWVKQGKIPPGNRLSARCTTWRRDTLEQFLKAAEGQR